MDVGPNEVQKGTAVLTISSLYCITDNHRPAMTIFKETKYKGVWRKLNVSSPFMCGVLGGQTCQAFPSPYLQHRIVNVHFATS